MYAKVLIISTLLVTLFELMVINNWWIIMEGFHAGTGHRSSHVFFILFHVTTYVSMKCVLKYLCVMHLSISCPNPHHWEGGRIQGFDKLSCQMPHSWDQVSCQILTGSFGQVLRCCNFKQ